MSKVKTWYMTPEQREEYVRKHPIVPHPDYRPRDKEAFDDIYKLTGRNKKK